MMLFMSDFSSYEAAEKKAADPNMTTENNPLFEGRPSAEDIIRDRNMKRLMCDAKLKSCPVNGRVYEAMMGMRYSRQED